MCIVLYLESSKQRHDMGLTVGTNVARPGLTSPYYSDATDCMLAAHALCPNVIPMYVSGIR